MSRKVAVNMSINPSGGVWAEVAGQTRAISQFSQAAAAARDLIAAQNRPADLMASPENATPAARTDAGTNLAAMTHSWLVVGPPGSGRSTAAKAFAAALECEDPDNPGCGICPACRDVRQGTHADVSVMTTEMVEIKFDDVKALVQQAYRRPVRGEWNIIIIEDYDRMSEYSSNLLLKSIEEPPERTVWVLCAPSAADVLSTVRSRTRLVQLTLPSPAAVAELLVRQDASISPELAAEVAAAAESHVGRARALAYDPQLRAERVGMLRMISQMNSSAEAMWTAAALVKLVDKQAEALRGANDREERAKVLEAFGLAADTPDSRLPRDVKSALRGAKLSETDAHRRARRASFDTWDRVLGDISGFYRDVLLAQAGSAQPRINLSRPAGELVDAYVARVGTGPQPLAETTARLEAIRRARRRLMGNGNATLDIEALCVELVDRNRAK